MADAKHLCILIQEMTQLWPVYWARLPRVGEDSPPVRDAQQHHFAPDDVTQRENMQVDAYPTRGEWCFDVSLATFRVGLKYLVSWEWR